MVTVVREEASALSVVDSVLAKVKAEGKRDITFAGNCSCEFLGGIPMIKGFVESITLTGSKAIDQVKNFLSSAKPTPTIVVSFDH